MDRRLTRVIPSYYGGCTGVTWPSEAVAHMWARHRVTPDEANEALCDPDRIVESPDHASRSGRTDRVIGYCPSLRAVLCVIVLHGERIGINAWPANATYRRFYVEGAIDEQQ